MLRRKLSGLLHQKAVRFLRSKKQRRKFTIFCLLFSATTVIVFVAVVHKLMLKRYFSAKLFC